MRTRRHRRRRLFRSVELLVLGSLVGGLVLLLAVTDSFDVIKGMVKAPAISQKKIKAIYQNKQKVRLKSSAKTNGKGKSLKGYRQWIGSIESSALSEDGKSILYTVSNGKKKVTAIKESDLQKAPKAKYKKGQTLQIASTAETDLDQDSLVSYRGKVVTVEKVHYNYQSQDGGYKYDVKVGEWLFTNIREKDLSDIYHVKLKKKGSASENNAILKAAFDYARSNPNTVLGLPSGEYTIGTRNPDSDYVTLASDTTLIGDNTTLIVDGTEYWFGFATGPNAVDGVRNFTMKNINIRAKDLVNGDHFMIMADHGDNWEIDNNTFTMVQKKGSHIFDLGGLQNSVFNGNQFIGYAPDLTNSTTQPNDNNAHDYYAEAIQLDNAENTGVWDANLLKNKDSNYVTNNATKHLSNNITIANNKFLPYYNASGQLVAYGATLGQHSSDVGAILVANNTFTASLVSRYVERANDWMFDPIHFPSTSTQVTLSNNTYN